MKHAVHRRPRPTPRLILTLTRRAGAPKRPSRAELGKLFQRAWQLVPTARRPDLRDRKTVVVDVLLVDDSEIAALNVSHLKVRGPTDVLSFPIGEVDPERKAYSLGEIVVSFDTASSEATARKLDATEELNRYCVHGFLHLLGYEDSTLTQRKELFAVQEKALKAK